MIGEEAAENVLREVRTVLQNSGFRFQNDWASILVGSEESLYSWLTVNYLLKRADTSTVGTLEMGGGSSQIAFVASRAPVLAGNCSIAGEDVDYEGSKVSLYTASHSNFGLQKARSLSLLAFESEGSLKENPCINEGKAVDVEVPFEDGKIVSMTGRGDFAKCKSSLVKALVKPIQEACDCDVCSYKGVSRPKPIDEYIAIAFYLERTISIGMVSPITAADIRKKGEQICNMSVDQVIRAFPDVPNGLATDLCMDLAFISMHLDKAHGVTEDVGTKLMVMNKINGFELGWCLGAMQQTMDKLYSQS